MIIFIYCQMIFVKMILKKKKIMAKCRMILRTTLL